MDARQRWTGTFRWTGAALVGLGLLMPSPAPAAPTPVAGPHAIAQADPAPADAPTPAETPPAPTDPLLAPADRPTRVLTSWDEAWQLLLEGSTDLRLAEAGVQRAEALWRQARAGLMPQIGASAALGFDVVNPDNPPLAASGLLRARGETPTSPALSASVWLQQPIIDVAARRGVTSAEAQRRAAEASAEDLRREASQGLARALVAVVAAERTSDINRLGLRQALERAALTQRTFELGRATQLDAVRVHQDVPVARAAVVAGDEVLRQTREALALALGLPGEVGVAPGFDLDGVAAQLGATCRPLAEGELRADLEAAEAQVAAARHRRRQVAAGALPQLDVATEAMAAASDPGPVAVGSWSIVAVLSVPLFEGGRREALVDEARALEADARERQEALRRAVAVDVSRTRRAEGVTRGLVDEAIRARDLARETDEMTRRSFGIGRATSLELVQSAVALRQAELTLALREFDWVEARLDALSTEARCR